MDCITKAKHDTDDTHITCLLIEVGSKHLRKLENGEKSDYDQAQAHKSVCRRPNKLKNDINLLLLAGLIKD